MQTPSLVVALLIAASPLSYRAQAAAAFGTVAAKIDRKVLEMVRDPTLPRIYATTTANTVIVVNTDTLAIDAEITVGSQPHGLDVSADGHWLYVANSGATVHGISVIDLKTLKVARTMDTTAPAREVATGTDGKLFLLAGKSLQQINDRTGDLEADSAIPKKLPEQSGHQHPTQQQPGDEAPPEGYQHTAFVTVEPARAIPVGFNANPAASPTPAGTPAGIDVMVYGGLIRTTPDRKTLFYGNTGLSPDTLYRLDVAGATPQVVQKVSLGSNGIDLTVSPGGDAVCYMAGSGNSNYDIAMLPANNIEGQLASFPTGPYPCNGAFSVDGNWFYTAPSSQHTVKIYDVKKGIQTLSFQTPNRNFGHLLCDRSGSYLFATNGVQTLPDQLGPLIIFSIRQ